MSLDCCRELEAFVKRFHCKVNIDIKKKKCYFMNNSKTWKLLTYKL